MDVKGKKHASANTVNGGRIIGQQQRNKANIKRRMQSSSNTVGGGGGSPRVTTGRGTSVDVGIWLAFQGTVAKSERSSRQVRCQHHARRRRRCGHHPTKDRSPDAQAQGSGIETPSPAAQGDQRRHNRPQCPRIHAEVNASVKTVKRGRWKREQQANTKSNECKWHKQSYTQSSNTHSRGRRQLPVGQWYLVGAHDGAGHVCGRLDGTWLAFQASKRQSKNRMSWLSLCS